MLFRLFGSEDNNKLLEAIRRGPEGTDFENAVTRLYQTREPFVKNYLRKNSRLEETEIEEIARESLFVLLENITNGKFQGRASINTYLTGIVKNKSKATYTRQNRVQELKQEDAWLVGNLDEELENREKKEEVLQLIEMLPNPKCKEILLWVESDEAMAVLAQRLGYKNVNTLYVTRHNCREELIKLMNKAGLYHRGEKH